MDTPRGTRIMHASFSCLTIQLAPYYRLCSMAALKPKNPVRLDLRAGKFSSRAGKARLSRLQVYSKEQLNDY